MWGTGGGAGQAHNWGFNANAQQYAQVANEQEKWAALAHQWIQMKTSGGGLEQSLQPPLPGTAPSVNNNGNAHSHTYSESEDYIGEAPMDLDDSVSQQNHLIQQSLQLQPMNAAGVNHQSFFTPDLITQIPANPTISFSSITPAVQQSIHLPQQPTSRVIPPLMQQPFHHIQPQITPVQQPVERLLQPSYLEQGRQTTPAYPSSSHNNSSNSKRRNRPHEPEFAEPAAANFQTHQQNDYGYSAESTNSDMFEGIPRRSLPGWIREGLEKVEQEKRRLEQKEREAELRKQKEAERRDQGLADSDEDNSLDSGYSKQGYEMPKPYIHTALVPEVQEAPLVSAMSKRTPNSSASAVGVETSQKASSLRRAKSPSLEELMEGMSEDDRLELAMGIVRRQLTFILLEVTTEEMRQVAKDSIARAKQKGLDGYESDSGSEGEGGGRRRAKVEEKAQSDSDDESSSDDSEAELIAEIERKRLNFELQENEFTTSRYEKEKGRPRPKKSPTPTPAPELPKENRRRNSSESRSEPPVPILETPKTISNVVPPPPKVDEHSDRRTSSASEHESSRKRKRSKSPERNREQRKHRSRSRERKKDSKRKSKSRSRSKEKERKRRSKSKSNERERDRRRKSKSKSRSRSRDRKNRRRSRSRSKDKDRKKKRSRRSRSKSRSRSRSPSDSSRRRRHRRRSSSSHSSSRSPERRKHKDKKHDKSKKKSRRSRSRSRSTSKSKSSRRSKGDKDKRHGSRSKSPAASTLSRAISN